MSYEQPPGAAPSTPVVPSDAAAPGAAPSTAPSTAPVVPYSGTGQTVGQAVGRTAVHPGRFVAQTLEGSAFSIGFGLVGRLLVGALVLIPALAAAVVHLVGGVGDDKHLTVPAVAPLAGVHSGVGTPALTTAVGHRFRVANVVFLPRWRVTTSATGNATVTGLRARNLGIATVTTAVELALSGGASPVRVTCAAASILPRDVVALYCAGTQPPPARVSRVGVTSLL